MAPDPSCFEETAANVPAMVHTATGWDADELGSVTTPTLLIAGTPTSSRSGTPWRCGS